MNYIKIFLLSLIATTLVYGKDGVYHRTQKASIQTHQLREIKKLLDLYHSDPLIPLDSKETGEEFLGYKIWQECDVLQKKISDPSLLKYVDVFDLDLFGDCNHYLAMIKNYLITMIQRQGSVRSKQAMGAIIDEARGSE